jgi:hypothetical protein
MNINLRKYVTEVRYWLGAFDQFIEHASKPALARLLRDLEQGLDNDIDPLPWKAPKAIISKPATKYDGAQKNAERVYLTWQFHAEFQKRKKEKGPQLWDVRNMVTHIKVVTTTEQTKARENKCTEREAIHFHYDLKEQNQLGPHSHMQISELFLQREKKVNLAVPRFPTAALLPTDCFDLVLSEFFPHEWPKAQADLTGLTTLQNGQRKRIQSLADKLLKQWDDSPKMTPIAKTQNCYMPDVQLA